MPEAFGIDQYGANFARGIWFAPSPCVGSVRLFTHNALIRQSESCFIRWCYVTIAWGGFICAPGFAALWFWLLTLKINQP